MNRKADGEECIKVTKPVSVCNITLHVGIIQGPTNEAYSEVLT